MPKAVGMTTNEEERKRNKERTHVGFSNWRIVLRGLTYKQAQDKETKYRNKGYVGYQGGSRKAGSNYVIYTFDYTRKR